MEKGKEYNKVEFFYRVLLELEESKEKGFYYLYYTDEAGEDKDGKYVFTVNTSEFDIEIYNTSNSIEELLKGLCRINNPLNNFKSINIRKVYFKG